MPRPPILPAVLSAALLVAASLPLDPAGGRLPPRPAGHPAGVGGEDRRAEPARAGDPSPLLCAALVRASVHGRAGLFPWHDAVLVDGAPGASPPAAGPAPPRDALARGRALLLAGRAQEAWVELRGVPAEGGDARFLRAWAAAAADAPEAVELLRPFTETPTPLACRAPALRAGALRLARAGDAAGAMALLERLGRALPEIPDHVRLWTMEALASAPGAPLAGAPSPDSIEALHRRLTALDPPDAVARAADRARAALLERGADAARAAAALAPLVTRVPRAERPALLVRLARLEGRLGRREAARARLRQVVSRHPESDEALALLAPGSVVGGFRPSARDSALVLAAHGRADEAARALTPTSDPELLALRAEIRLRDDDYAAAARDFAAALGRGGGDVLRMELAKALGRDGHPAAAREIYEDLLDAGGGGSRAATLTYQIADAYQDESVTRAEAADSAAVWFRRLVDRHPRAGLASRGLMRLAHLRFARGEWSAAEALYREHLRRYPRDEDGREARYWLARALVESGRAGEARDLLAGLLSGDPSDYYLLLARRRLASDPEAAVAALFASAGDPAGLDVRASAPAPADTVLPVGVAGEARLRRARSLMLVGEEEAAQREIDEALRLAGRRPAELRRVAGWALAHGFPESAFRVATLLLAGGDSALARLAFPPAFPANVIAEAREHGVPASLLWSVMRQESRFDPAVRSPAGAVGLLQLMPATARREAAAARAASFEVSDLRRPEVNLHLGARHLRGLLERMEGDVPAALAAYNAGAVLAQRWRDFPEAATPEGYVERIPFRETRGYVKRILSNRAWYEDLYGD